jgi:hypothetical protein
MKMREKGKKMDFSPANINPEVISSSFPVPRFSIQLQVLLQAQ